MRCRGGEVSHLNLARQNRQLVIVHGGEQRNLFQYIEVTRHSDLPRVFRSAEFTCERNQSAKPGQVPTTPCVRARILLPKYASLMYLAKSSAARCKSRRLPGGDPCRSRAEIFLPRPRLLCWEQRPSPPTARTRSRPSRRPARRPRSAPRRPSDPEVSTETFRPGGKAGRSAVHARRNSRRPRATGAVRWPRCTSGESARARSPIPDPVAPWSRWDPVLPGTQQLPRAQRIRPQQRRSRAAARERRRHCLRHGHAALALDPGPQAHLEHG